jgi:copper homeostasis protein
MPELTVRGTESVELEVIASSLEDALAAQEGGASRLEVAVRLDQAGLTPPLALVRQIAERVSLPARIMVRERADFVLSDSAELETLKQRGRAFAALGVEGLVIGYVKGGRLDLETVARILEAAPAARVTLHHAIEMTADPVQALRDLGAFPNVDRALVRGGNGTLVERVDRLRHYARALGPGRRLMVGGNLTLEALGPMRRGTGLSAFHLGRAVRTPEEASGGVNAAKVRRAVELINAAI